MIRGGIGSQCGNPCDVTDEGIFISEVSTSKFIGYYYTGLEADNWRS